MSLLRNSRTSFAVCTLLTAVAWVSVIGQTQPAGQVSRKTAAKPTTPTAVKPISAPASTTCPTVGPAPANAYEATEVAVYAQTAAATATNADNLSAVAKAYVKKAQAAFGIVDTTAITGDKVLSALTDAAHQADILADYAALADDCSKQANAPFTGTNGAALVAAAKNVETARDQALIAFQNIEVDLKTADYKCRIVSVDSNGNPVYDYRAWLPLHGTGCDDSAKLYYFQVGKTATFANQAQYLYNAEQSTSQVNADLMTATFSLGFQAVLAGTATAGSSQPAASSSSTTTTPSIARRHDSTSTSSTSTTDSVATTVSKLEQGGDFNLRFPYPLFYGAKAAAGITGVITMTPNVGFSLNGVSGQNTITETTNYSLNVPLELYGQLNASPASPTQATIYGDVKYGGEWISQPLAQKIGLPQVFGLGVASAGIEFAKSVRIGMQYYFGPHQAYCAPNTSGTCTPATASVNGFHLVVSFSPSVSAP